MATTTDTESGEAMTGDRKAEVAALVKTIDGLYSQRSEGPWWQESWETPTPPAGAGRELSELLCHFSDEGKPRFWCWNTDGKLVVALENAWPIIRKSLMSQTTEGTMTAQVEAGAEVSREPSSPNAAMEAMREALKVAERYIEAVVVNTPDRKKQRNYGEALQIVRAALSQSQPVPEKGGAR